MPADNLIYYRLLRLLLAASSSGEAISLSSRRDPRQIRDFTAVAKSISPAGRGIKKGAINARFTGRQFTMPYFAID